MVKFGNLFWCPYHLLHFLNSEFHSLLQKFYFMEICSVILLAEDLFRCDFSLLAHCISDLAMGYCNCGSSRGAEMWTRGFCLYALRLQRQAGRQEVAS